LGASRAATNGRLTQAPYELPDGAGVERQVRSRDRPVEEQPVVLLKLTGWWGGHPPYHVPVFVLTQDRREPLPMRGGTTFTFVTVGIESALDQARAAAGNKNLAIAGGASAVQQYLAAGMLDELYLHIVPITLGAGERLLEKVGDRRFEPLKVVASPAVAHIKYRVVG
jgi:dihydrofolate reductase